MFELCKEFVIDFGPVLTTVIDYKEDMLLYISYHPIPMY